MSYYSKSYEHDIRLANYFIHYEHLNGRIITNNRLQKLMFLTQQNFLKQNNISLFALPFSTWSYGPVIEEIFYKYSLIIGDLMEEKNAGVVLPIEKYFIEKTCEDYKNFSLKHLIQICGER